MKPHKKNGNDNMPPQTSFLDINPNKMGAPDTVKYATEFEKGLSAEVVKRISEIKSEPEWMLQNRLKAFEHFLKRPMPTWGPNLSAVNFSEIVYFRSSGKNSNNWKDVPEQIKNTFERLGIPEAERKFLAGAGAQFESESIYHKIRDDLAKLGVIFCDMDTALKLYPELVKKYFGTVVPYNDNKFAALNTAVWSGGSFVFVPKGVRVDLPLQAYFRINAERTGQFERTLIIVEEGASCHYIEGCSAPSYAEHSLHAAVVEVIALPGSRVRYTTLQNWATNVFNLVTKRAHAHAGAYVEWVDANVGSAITMKYPSVFLIGEGARADILSVAFANSNQIQDTGAKAIHAAPNTSSTILSKSVSKGSGFTNFRGLVEIYKGARNSKSHMKCDALMLDKESRSDTIPTLKIDEKEVQCGHEAVVGKVSEDQLFYLMSRGLTEDQATTMIVSGFLQAFTKSLPLEYAIEFNRLIELEMTGAVG